MAVLARATALVAVVAGLVSCAAAGTDASYPPGDPALPERVASGVRVDRALDDLRAFQAIADRFGGNRALGTPGYDASVDHVVERLQQAGFRVETPTFTAEDDDGEEVTTRNVVAQTTTGRPDEVVLAGAHLDSVREGPGIDDNGSGAAGLLEVATALGGAPPVGHQVRFVWFGAEEQGLYGSKDYVEELSSSGRADLALMLNADMIAGPNGGYFVYDGDRSDGRGQRGPQGSEIVEQVLVDRFAARGITARGAPFLEDDSDYGPFVEAGIPSGGLFTGDEGRKTPEEAAMWGGRAGEAYDPCYHQRCDDLTNIDPAVFARMLDTLAFGVGSFGVDLRGLPSRSERGG